MALDSSRSQGFSVPPQEKSVLDGYLITNSGRYNSCSLCNFNGNLEGNPCFEMIKSVLGDFDDSEEAVVDDDGAIDHLPRDPFGMNMESDSISVSDWFDPYEWGEDGLFRMDEPHQKNGDHLHFLGLSWAWNGAEDFNWQEGGSMGNEISVSGIGSYSFQYVDEMYDGGVVDYINERGILSDSYRDNWVSSSEIEESKNCSKIVCDVQAGVPHDALFFVLGYLGVRDLLSVEMVCIAFRDAVRGDPLLWRTVHIDQPLNQKITDDKLVKLTSRAQGTLESLILVNCFWITDNGLGCVIQSNPRLMKLIVPDCMRLSIMGILYNLRALKRSGAPGIKHIRIGGLGGVCSVTDQQFEELKELLDANKYMQQRDLKPQFYRGGYSHMIDEDGRAIDIEVCPRCQKLRPVYDCPAESCQQKHQDTQLCRGCSICIARCIHCGRCIKDFDYEETFCMELLCLNCFNQILHHSEKSVEMEATSCTIISHTTMYQFYLYG